MTINAGNHISQIGIDNAIKEFQRVGYQILYGTYIDDKFKTPNKVLEYDLLYKEYGTENINSLYYQDVKYYRITETECSNIIQFLNSGLKLVCTIQTICEEKGFELLKS